jgi:sulfhydrogenase subunit alpha
MTERRSIRVERLARVEGEGALELVLSARGVEDVKLSIFEPPRFFEALLRGRRYDEAPDITARICGICPVAYQMSAVQAIEAALGVRVEAPVRALRRLMYCGEWLQSHALHVHMLHAPDFRGVHDVIELAAIDHEFVERGLRLKKAGNAILAVLGGRAIHPINVRVGGFHRAPDAAQLDALRGPLEAALADAIATVDAVAGFDFPDFDVDCEFVALRHPTEYPLNDGRIVSTRGIDVPVHEHAAWFAERQVPHSTALHAAVRDAGSYQVGPSARFSLNADRLTPEAAAAARRAGLEPPVTNPFRSIVVRAVEMVFACEEALAILATRPSPTRPAAPVLPHPGVGHAATEAPRGILHHTYAIDADGLIRSARIVPPTAQNQPRIEDDLRAFVTARLDQPDEALRKGCEQAVRNYDPCISCATHFLDVRILRR